MNDASLTELERTQGEANMKFAEATAAKEAAANHLAAAEQAYYDALENYTFGDAPEENYDKKEAAKEALEAAKAAQEAAVAAEQEAAKAAQDAADAVEAKKKNLRATRLFDTTYVVHCARIECKCGRAGGGKGSTRCSRCSRKREGKITETPLIRHNLCCALCTHRVQMRYAGELPNVREYAWRKNPTDSADDDKRLDTRYEYN